MRKTSFGEKAQKLIGLHHVELMNSHVIKSYVCDFVPKFKTGTMSCCERKPLTIASTGPKPEMR